MNTEEGFGKDFEIHADSDRFWDRFWLEIDQAKDLVAIATYDMDHKMIAGITMHKLVNARKRGVQVVLIIDDLNYYASSQQIKQLREAGGIVLNNNPFTAASDHISNGQYYKFFNRNH